MKWLVICRTWLPDITSPGETNDWNDSWEIDDAPTAEDAIAIAIGRMQGASIPTGARCEFTATKVEE